MASAAQHSTRFTVWLYRSLALGSTVAVAIHTAPLMDNASLTHAIKLSRSQELFLAKSGVRRIIANARKSDAKRQRLREHGALSALSECAARGDEQLREAAFLAVALIAPGDCEAVFGQRGLRDALATESCGEGCRAVWKGFGLEHIDVVERRRILEKLRAAG